MTIPISTTFLASLMLAVLSACVQAAPARPNIVVILADDLGYGDPGCYNARSRIATPNIDRLAREGMRFTDAHAPGALCHPSRYGLLTGRHPFRTDVSKWPKEPLIEERRPTLASVLKEAGYHTAMVGKWHLGFAENGYEQSLPGGPVHRGFDSFFGFRASTDISPYFYIRGDRAVEPPTATIAEHHTAGIPDVRGEFWRGGGIAPGLELKDVLPRFTEEAVAVIRAHAKESAEKPLLLYFAPTAPHTPWLPSAEFKGRSPAGMYGDFTVMLDAMIGRVLQALEDAKLADNTLLIFTSDNGPVWYPEDVERTGHDASGGLRGMKGTNWEGGHRMPFIVRWPGKVQPGSTSSHMICFTDVLATAAAAVGATLPADAGPDSFNFLPVLLGAQPEGRPVRESLVVGRSIRRGPWKYIDGREPVLFSRPGSAVFPPPGEPPGQLYNLADDRGETRNLAAANPALVSELQAEMRRIQSSSRTRP